MLRRLRRKSNTNSDQPQSIVGSQEDGDSQLATIMPDNNGDDKEEKTSRCCPFFPSRTTQNQSSDKKKDLTSPWALHSNEQLSPRASAWMYIAAVSMMCLGTFLVTEGRTDAARSDNDTLMLAIFATCFSVSFAITLAYRHRSLRYALTCDLKWIHYSIEFILSIILFCLWCVVMRVLLDPFSAMNFAVTSVVATSDTGQIIIWNVNLWVGAWLGYGILSFLVGSLLLVSPIRKRGTWSNIKTNRHRYEFDENRTTYWFMFLAFQLALSAFTMKLKLGDACTGSLGMTSFCKRASLGLGVGLTNSAISCASLLLSHLDQMGKLERWGVNREKTIWRIEGCLSLLSLTLSSCNLGYSTSPGGPGTEIGNVFVTSIVGVVVSLLLCEQILDSCMLRVCVPDDDGDDGCKDESEGGAKDEQVDLEMGKRQFLTPRLSVPIDESSSSSSSSEALRESIYPPDFGHDDRDDESSSYSLPDPAPIAASTSSTKEYDASTYDESRAESGVDLCSLSVNRGTVDSSDEDSESTADSGVDLCFEPDHDVSSIDCSIPSKVPSQISGVSSIDPDGYKSEDNYDAREAKLSTAHMRITKRKNAAANKFDRNEVLEPVAELRHQNTEADEEISNEVKLYSSGRAQQMSNHVSKAP